MPNSRIDFMIKRLRYSEKQAKKWYDKVYLHGGYKSADPRYDDKMLDQLGVPTNMNLNLLDIACGNGFLLHAAEKRTKTFGMDISENAVKNAKLRAKKTLFSCGSAEKLPFPDDFFDFVTCLGSMEHFINVDTALTEIKRVLVDGGKANIHVPNSLYLVHKLLRLDTQGQPNERLATEAEWREIIEKHLTIEKVHKYNTRPYLAWIPKKYCCHFTFICRKE